MIESVARTVGRIVRERRVCCNGIILSTRGKRGENLGGGGGGGVLLAARAIS